MYENGKVWMVKKKVGMRHVLFKLKGEAIPEGKTNNIINKLATYRLMLKGQAADYSMGQMFY